MHDNSMKKIQSISDQLRRRRSQLALSLSDVARRAGTSPATLSRYEHGWTRFETYTLRKLAAALGCELRIEFIPRTAQGMTASRRSAAKARLKRLFWDHPLEAGDLETYSVWVVERVLEFGNLADVRALRDLMGRDAFLKAVQAARRVSSRTRNFWCQVLDLEGIPCTKKCSRNTVWNS